MQWHVLSGHINLQKGDLGAVSLIQHLRTFLRTDTNEVERSFLIGIQEPPITKGKIRSLSSEHNLIYDHSSVRPRAAIYVSRDINFWPMMEFSGPDIATGLWKTGQNYQKEVIVTSVYMDITNEGVWPSALGRLLDFCRRKSKVIIIMADTNAHSTLWNCPESNKRGEIMEEFIFSHNLTVCNLSNKPTFLNRRSATIIDVTITSPQIQDWISNWEVSDKVTGSNHKLISFFFSTVCLI